MENDINTVKIRPEHFDYLKTRIADLEKENERLTTELKLFQKNYHSLLKRLYAIDELCKFVV